MSAKPMPPNWREMLEAAEEMALLKAKLGRLGLFKTMQLMDAATKAVGYEIESKAP